MRIDAKGLPKAAGPYSHGVAAGSMAVTSGQLPVDPATGQIPPGIRDQARLALSNAMRAAEALGEGFQIISVRIYLADIGDFGEVNEVYRELFSEPYPARTCIGGVEIPKGARIEVEAMAAKGGIASYLA